MYKYLLDVTFYAGSDDPDDIDKGLFLLSVDKEFSEEEMENLFKNTNRLLCPFNEDTSFPHSYDDGLNIQTLLDAITYVTKGELERLSNDCGKLSIDNFYQIEQWQ